MTVKVVHLLFYVGHADERQLNLTLNGTVADAATFLSNVTRMVLKVGSETVDSNTNANAFDWTTLGSGGLILRAGSVLTTVGENLATLQAYTPTRTDGVDLFTPYSDTRLLVTVRDVG